MESNTQTRMLLLNNVRSRLQLFLIGEEPTILPWADTSESVVPFIRRLTFEDLVHGLCEKVASELLLADLVLVEWSAERLSAIAMLCAQLRNIGLPVFVLCDDDPANQVAALVIGADYVIASPMNVTLLHAYLAAYRRMKCGGTQPVKSGDGTGSVAAEEVGVQRISAPEEGKEDFHLGSLRLDREFRRAIIGDRLIQLHGKQFDLLHFLMQHAGDCCSRDTILEQVWGVDFETGTNLVDVQVCALRKKLETYGFNGILQTVRGLGYRLNLDACCPDSCPETGPASS